MTLAWFPSLLCSSIFAQRTPRASLLSSSPEVTGSPKGQESAFLAAAMAGRPGMEVRARGQGDRECSLLRRWESHSQPSAGQHEGGSEEFVETDSG